jgi:hypothetical protein
MDLVEIKKDVRSQTAKRVAQAVINTGDPALLPAKTPPVKRAAKKLAPAPTSGPGPAPVKRAVRTRKPAAKAAAPTPPTGPTTPPPVSSSIDPAKYRADRLEGKLRAKEETRAKWQDKQRAKDQARFKTYADSLESRMKAQEAGAERRKKLQRAAAVTAGGTAAVGAVGGAVAARRAMRLRHMPAPGLNTTQRAVIGTGAGAAGGMLLAQRRRES